MDQPQRDVIAYLREENQISREIVTHDLIAGLTVGIIALPLAMAFGIGSIPQQVAAEAGISPPAMGLYTAVVAGRGPRRGGRRSVKAGRRR